MPIRKIAGGWKWGSHGKVYASRKGAERQAAAAHAAGFHEDEETISMKTPIIKYLEEGMVDVDNHHPAYSSHEQSEINHITDVITSHQSDFPDERNPKIKGTEWKFLDLDDLDSGAEVEWPEDVSHRPEHAEGGETVDLDDIKFPSNFDANEAHDFASALKLASEHGKVVSVMFEDGESFDIDPITASDIMSSGSDDEINESFKSKEDFITILEDVLLAESGGFEDVDDDDDYDEPDMKHHNLGINTHGSRGMGHLDMGHKKGAKVLVSAIAAIKKHFPHASVDKIKKVLDTPLGHQLLDKVADNVHGEDDDLIDFFAERGVDRHFQNAQKKFVFAKHLR